MSEKLNKEYIEKVKKLNNGATYNISTFGCVQNENDSEKIAGMLEEMRYKSSSFLDANVIVLNTCAIRENAEERLFSKLGEAKSQHKKGAIIILCGCMVQEKHVIEKLKKSYPYVDIIFGTNNLFEFPKLLYDRLNGQREVVAIDNLNGNIYEDIPTSRNSSICANVTIINGCNNYCTYCIVPYVRGKERSRNPKDVICEIEELAKKGYKQINLLGQNVNSYLEAENLNNISYEKYKGIDSFAKLLDEICKIDGIESIKFLSPHPKNFTDDVIDVIAKNDKIEKLIHLPLQSGSTKVLKQMNRKYTKEQYLTLVEKLKNKIPNLALTTDIIVGFPGESEQDFEDTLDIVSKVGFEQIFMFIYSPRVGTMAASMDDQIPDDISHKRFDKLKELYEQILVQKNKEYIGKIYPIIVEGTSKNDKNYLTGRTYSNKVVIFEGKSCLIGKKVNVKILSEHKWYLKGKIE